MRSPWPHHRTAILLASLALAAALVDLGAFHALEHADSIVPVLVSLQRWTPFYWDQERYGMLVPLLALPVRDPLWNLFLQRGLLVLAGLAAVLLLARHVLAGRDWPLAGALAAGGLLLAAPAPWLCEDLGDQPYGVSIALALAGLAVAEPGKDGRRGPAISYQYDPWLRRGSPSIPPEKLEEMRARAKPFPSVATDAASQTPGFSVRALAQEAKERALR